MGLVRSHLLFYCEVDSDRRYTVCLIKSVSGSFDRQFTDIFASIDRYTAEIEKTAAAVSLLYVKDVKDVQLEMKTTVLAQRDSMLHRELVGKLC